MTKRLWLAAAVLLFIGMTYFMIGPSKIFKDCIREREQGSSYQTARESLARMLLPWVRRQTACSFIAANENAGAITGIAGLVVAIFTFTLWLSTDKIGRLGEKQAQIAEVQTDVLRKQSDIIAAQMQISSPSYSPD